MNAEVDHNSFKGPAGGFEQKTTDLSVNCLAEVPKQEVIFAQTLRKGQNKLFCADMSYKSHTFL